MPKSSKIERSQKLFLKAMKEKFAMDTETPQTTVWKSRTPVIPGTVDNKRIKVHVTLIPDKKPIFRDAVQRGILRSIENDE